MEPKLKYCVVCKKPINRRGVHKRTKIKHRVTCSMKCSRIHFKAIKALYSKQYRERKRLEKLAQS